MVTRTLGLICDVLGGLEEREGVASSSSCRNMLFRGSLGIVIPISENAFHIAAQADSFCTL